jgi:hypothetical protein
MRQVTSSSSTQTNALVKCPIEVFFRPSKVPVSSVDTPSSKPFPPDFDSDSELAHLAVTRHQLDSLSAAVVTLPNLTRSQRLFSAGTNICADTLKITTNDEFFLFMML